MTALSPLRRRSVVDEAADALQALILHGTWAPGDRVPTEATLTAELGVSRSTVREALNRLAASGLISHPHGGTKVVQDPREHGGLELLSAMVVGPGGTPNLSVVRDVTEMRGALAPDVARRAAQRRRDDEAAALVEASRALDPDAALGELMEATVAWWALLVRASHNVAYQLAFNTLRTTYTEGRGLQQQLMARELRHADGYRAVAGAVQRRDPDEASRAGAALVSLGNDDLYAALAAAGG